MFKFFKAERGQEAAPAERGTPAAARISRRSTGFTEFMKVVSAQQELNLLDLGPTSPQNIAQLTGMGHRIYNEDVLLASVDPEYMHKDAEGNSVVDIDRFLDNNLKHQPQQFDAVLIWDIPDYLHESLVKPMIERLASITKPGGVMLAFFHTKDAGPDAPYYRYHIAGKDTLELQRGPQFRLQRAFNNRHIENLFREFSSLKFFLARDNVREVLVVR